MWLECVLWNAVVGRIYPRCKKCRLQSPCGAGCRAGAARAGYMQCRRDRERRHAPLTFPLLHPYGIHHARSVRTCHEGARGACILLSACPLAGRAADVRTRACSPAGRPVKLDRRAASTIMELFDTPFMSYCDLFFYQTLISKTVL